MTLYSMSSIRDMLKITNYFPLILPLLNLALVFLQQSTSGLTYAVASILHVFSNPIDAMWSILCRQDAVRHSYLFSIRYTPDVGREFAVVLATYDYWLEDAWPKVKAALDVRRQLRSGLDPSQSLLAEKEKALVRRAALRLRSCHLETAVNARVSAMAYMVSLVVLFWKVLQWDHDDMRSEAGHIFSLIAAFSHLLFSVRLNGSTGTFIYQDEATRVIFELCTDLKAVALSEGYASALLEPPTSRLDSAPSSGTSTTSSEFSSQCSQLGFASGTLNCIRAMKSCRSSQFRGQSTVMLALISTCAVIVSSLGAIGITLTSPAWNNVVALSSIAGCASLWLTNWLYSIGMSILLSRNKIGIKGYGRSLLWSDILVAVAIACCFGWSFLFGHAADETARPTNATELIIWLVLMLSQLGLQSLLELWADLEGARPRYLYSRSLDEALADNDAMYS